MENAYVQEFSNLWVASLNKEAHERTSGYWYTVTNGAVAHTAFKTKPELETWLSERGLALSEPLPNQGDWARVRVLGGYRKVMDRDVNRFRALRPLIETTVMDNARMTPAKITEEGGVRTVHFMNVNYR